MGCAGNRRRHADELDSDDDSQQPNYKRAKTEAGDDLPSSELDSDMDDGGGEGEEGDDDDASTIDSDYEEPDFDDNDLLAAYRQYRKEQKGYVGSASQAGVIKSITLIDFMCHRHLKVDFGPRMNFVVGHNGSGKSAVLTGIAVALGGKATLTGRGQGLKDLIRKGADRAVIIVTLFNDGEMAYRKDVFDPNIVIERTIHQNGSSQYRFKATREGRILANKRSELTAISEFFNINIDSPLTILTQDQSRGFLQNADPSKLYKFFLNGTQLSTLLDTYEAATQNIDQLATYITRQQEALPDLKDKCASLKRQIQASKKVMKQQRKNHKLLTELCWSYVIEKENLRNIAQGRVHNLEEKIERAQAEVHKIDKQIPILADQTKATEKDLQSFEDTAKPLQHAVNVAKAKQSEARKELRSMESSLEELGAKLEEERISLRRLEQQIVEQLRLKEPDQQDAREKLLARRNKLEDILGKMKLERPARERDRDEKFQEQNKLKAELNGIDGAIGDCDQQRQYIKRQIDDVHKSKHNRLLAFGHNIEPLMREINRTQWKHSKPIGPMGMHVNLEDMRYAEVLQAFLGSLLCGFAVRDHEDSVKLGEMIRRHFEKGYRPGNVANDNSARPPAVYKHSGDHFNFSHGDLSKHGSTVLSVLKIDNDDVLRILVDHSNIEKTMVAPSLMEGNKMIDHMLSTSNLPFLTVNCADNMTTSGSKSGRNSGPVNKYKGKALFAKDPTSAIAGYERQLQENDARRQELLTERQVVDQRIRDLQKEMSAISEILRTLSKKVAPLEENLDETKRKLLDTATTEMDSTEALRDELQEGIVQLELKIQESTAEVERQQQVYEQRGREVQERQKESDAHAPNKAKYLAVLGDLVTKQSELLNAQKHYMSSITGYEKNLAAAQEHLESVEEDVKVMTDKAVTYAPKRQETQRSSADLEAERAALDKSIQEASLVLGHDLTELTAAFRKARHRQREANGSIKDLKFLRKVLNGAMRNRHAWWHETRSHISIRAKTAFVVFESFRNMEGRLNFVHESQKLSLVIHNSTTSESQDGTMTQTSHYKGAKSLSGGERSFSTVSLLLALWATVPCPIRALDEWDVFLDAANRKVAAKNLMEGAKQSDGKQYILITPLDMQGIDTAGPDKKVIRMADPVRNQGTIATN
ncbi:hypothetical protein B9479_000788 [Cryptococcus floricola]|uniref:RecF/RecN/SMC N-terminal domain-containing protein n=1 Tax=Cryptococcus floricola TaxID=2591691 RepID=A0A5D3B6D8_9TREE|nr:hypothetical protein B9479_000788 [Cryptococcus floricola]